MDILNFAGSGRGLSRDLNPADTQFAQIVFQTDKPVGDDELNYIQHIAEYNLRRYAAGLCSDGLMGKEQFVFTGEANLFYLQKSYWLFDSFPLLVADSAWNSVINGQQLNHAIQIPAGSPPGGNLIRTDEIFLEFWFQEVAPPGATNADTTVPELGGVANPAAPSAATQVLNTFLNRETTRRIQSRWRIRVAPSIATVAGQIAWGGIDGNNTSGFTYALKPGSLTLYRAGALDNTDAVRDKSTQASGLALNSVNGFSYAIHLASVNRRPGVTTIAATDIVSGPPHCALQIDVPRSVVVPALPSPLPGEDIFPVQFIYDGVVGDTTNATGIQENSLASSSLATNFVVPPPSGSIQTSYTLSRAEIKLARRGTGGVGTDVIADIVVDAAGPTGAVAATFIIPKEWLTGIARMISIPFNVSLAYGTKYWLRLHQTGDGTNYVAWIGQPTADADRTRSRSTTGSVSNAWPTTLPSLHLSVFSGVGGGMRNIIEGVAPALTVTVMEFDANGILYTGEAAYQSDGTKESANLSQALRDPASGAIVEMVLVNGA